MAVDSEVLQAIFDRIEAGKHLDPQDLQILIEAVRSQQVTVASGDRAVAIGGNANNAVIITGDRNILIPQELAQALQEKIGKAGNFSQQIGDRQTVDTGGGDSVGGNLDKSTQIVNNFFLFGKSQAGVELHPPYQGLNQLLAQLGASNLVRQAYRESLPADAFLSRPEVANCDDMVAQLQEFRRLPEFIQRLVQDDQIPPEARNQLKDIFQELSRTEQSQPSIVPHIPTTRILQSYLQIVLRCDRSSNGFVINGWLIPDDEVLDPTKRFQPLDIDDQRKGVACQLKDIPGVLDQYLNLSLQYLLGRRYELTIEIFLPLDYLCTGVDSWKLNHPFIEGESYVVGTEYRMIVRSQERLELKYLATRLNQWYANWDRLKSCWSAVPSEADFERLSDMENCNWKRVGYNLTEKLGLQLTCGLMETHKKKLFTCILQAAAPVAIWARCNCAHWDQVAEMKQLLHSGPLLMLAEMIRRRRIDADLADKPDDDLGAHLALLWEDPYRLTPDALVQLVPPGQ